MFKIKKSYVLIPESVKYEMSHFDVTLLLLFAMHLRRKYQSTDGEKFFYI